LVSFLTNITGIAQLWQIPVEGGWPVQLTFTNESVRGGHYNPRRHEIIYSMDAGGNERTQLYRLTAWAAVPITPGNGWMDEDLTREPKAIHTSAAGAMTVSRLLSAPTARTRADLTFTSKDSTSGGVNPLSRLVSCRKAPADIISARLVPDDRWLLAYKMESNFNQDLYAIEVARAGHAIAK